LRRGDLEEILVPVAPLGQQRRIVAEIEKQFSRLDEAVANLKRVKTSLRRYKAAVLADALEGTLAGDTSGWRATCLGTIASSVRNGISIKPIGERGTRILRISAVRPMALDLDDVRYVAQPPEAVESFRLGAGDVLFTRYNGSVDLVGVCAAVPELPEPTVYPDKLIRVRVPSDVLLPSFLVIAASTGEARAFIGSRVRTTAGQAGVSGADVKAIPLRVPPLGEQHRIVAEVDRRLSIVREVEAEVDANLKRAHALRQAVLAKAFRVP
jgi:type I restriction enzyme S subunit